MFMPTVAVAGDRSRRALTLSTAAFTICFDVWTICSIIGIQIKLDLALSDTQSACWSACRS